MRHPPKVATLDTAALGFAVQTRVAPAGLVMLNVLLSEQTVIKAVCRAPIVPFRSRAKFPAVA